MGKGLLAKTMVSAACVRIQKVHFTNPWVCIQRMSESKHRKPSTEFTQICGLAYSRSRDRTGKEKIYMTERAFSFQCVAILNTKIMSKRHGKIWRNPFGAVRGQTLFPQTRIQTQGAHEWCTHVDVVPWLCIGQDKCGCTQMPVCHSHLFERVLLGYHNALLFLSHITGKSSGEIPTLNSTWKNLFLVFIWQVPLCPEAWLAAGGLPCKASCHVEQTPILAFGTTLYLWGRVPPRLPCSPCSRWEFSGRLRTPARALLQNMCLWPHILALPLLCTASMTSQALTKKRKVAVSCLTGFTQCMSSCSCLHSLYYISRRWDNTRTVYLHTL